MTEQPRGARLLAHYRDAIEPSEAQLAAVWRDVSDPDARPRILGPRRARPDRRRGLRLVIGGGLVALAAAAAVAWWVGSTWRRTAVAIEDAGMQAPYGAEAGEPEQRAVRREPAREVVVAPTSEGVGPAAAISEAAPTKAAAVPAREASASRSRPRAAKLDPLVRETELLRQAEASLRTDDAAGALDVLAEHAREFPRSRLAVERGALRVIALCRSGKQAQGRGEAVVLERHAASRPYRERIRRACEGG